MKILFAIDFSSASINAANYGIDLFGPTHDYTLFHVTPVTITSTGNAQSGDPGQNHARIKLAELKKKLESKFPNLKIKQAVVSGFTDRSVMKFAKKEDINLIIFGNDHGHTWLSSFVTSSVASIIEETQIPIMSVPEDCKKSATTVGYYQLAQAGQSTPEKKIFNRLVHRRESKVVLLTDQSLPRISFEPPAETPYAQMNTVNVPQDNLPYLIRTIKSEQIDLLFIEVPGNGFWRKLLHTSLAQRIMLKSPIPMIFLKLKKEAG